MENFGRFTPVTSTIETPRLQMRPHGLHDFPDCAAMWADPDVTRFIGGRPFSQEEVWARLLRYAGHWSLLGFGFWAVVEKSTGAFIGEIGFADFKREIDPPLDLPEIGWVLTSRAQGNGYATEGVRAAVAWGDGHFPSRGSVCIIDPENARSVRVAEKCGYQALRQASYKGHVTTVFARQG